MDEFDIDLDEWEDDNEDEDDDEQDQEHDNKNNNEKHHQEGGLRDFDQKDGGVGRRASSDSKLHGGGYSVQNSNEGWAILAEGKEQSVNNILQQHYQNAIESGWEVLGKSNYDRGQAEILLREFNWSLDALKKHVLSKQPFQGVTKTSETQLEPQRKCVCVNYLNSSKKEHKQQHKIKQSKVYKQVKLKLKDRLNSREVINSLRSAPHNFSAKDILKALQVALSSPVDGVDIPLSTGCEKRRGIGNRHTGVALKCGHFRCKEHWDLFLTYQANAGIGCLTLKCNHLICSKQHVHSWSLGCFCSERVVPEVFSRFIASKKAKQNYQKWAFKHFRDHLTNSGIIECPSASCSRYWTRKNNTTTTTDKQAAAASATVIDCLCGSSMCGSCGSASHFPLPCSSWRDWTQRANQDRKTHLWTQLNTAPCPNPKCGVVIERVVTDSDHCLHMICSKCKHHWCWACRKPFKVGDNGNHDNYYKCKFLQQGLVDESVQKRERILRESQMYEFYSGLMGECSEDLKNFTLLKTHLEHLCKTKTEQAPQGHEDLSFLTEALAKLIEATKKKKIMYPVAFYSAEDGKKKLFEFQVKWMEKHYESLKNIIINTDEKNYPNQNLQHQNRKFLQMKKLMKMMRGMGIDNSSGSGGGNGSGTNGSSPWRRGSNSNNANRQAALERLKLLKSQMEQQLKRSKENNDLDDQQTKAIRLMRPLHYYLQHKDEIVKLSVSVSDFFRKLFKKVTDGALVTILDKPDPNNKTWYCSKCNRANTFGESVCECAWTAVGNKADDR
mmetsp:Transcript_25847/g.45910  ORF Transcript_25847/g.45910 Transcript_25847/m.45910 type:complete len:782 (-) Transcript_25847:137-2482(-)